MVDNYVSPLMQMLGACVHPRELFHDRNQKTMLKAFLQNDKTLTTIAFSTFLRFDNFSRDLVAYTYFSMEVPKKDCLSITV